MRKRSFYCRNCHRVRSCRILRKCYHKLSIKVRARCTICGHTFDGRIKKPVSTHSSKSHAGKEAVHL